MAHSWSGSKTSLLMKCQYSARPDIVLPEQESSEAADVGTDRHECLENYANAMLGLSEPMSAGMFFDKWHAEIPAEDIMSNISTWFPNLLDPKIDSVIIEQPFALNPEEGTVRLLEKSSHREYVSLLDTEVPMTNDLAYIVSTGWGKIGYVIDYKTGAQRNLPAIAENHQMRALALALAKYANLDAVNVGIAIVDDFGLATLQVTKFDFLDLINIEGDMRDLWRKIHNDPQPNPGSHCQINWCKARSICPLLKPAIKNTPIESLSFSINSDEMAARLVQQIDLAEAFIAHVKKSLKEYVKENGEVTLEDGAKYRWVKKSRESLKTCPELFDLLKKYGYDDAIEMKSSKTKIADVIRTKTEKGKQTATIRDFDDVLRDLGLLQFCTYETTELISSATVKRLEKKNGDK